MDAMVTKLSGGLRPPYVYAFSHVVGCKLHIFHTIFKLILVDVRQYYLYKNIHHMTIYYKSYIVVIDSNIMEILPWL